MRRRTLVLTIGVAGLVLIVFATPLALLLRSAAEAGQIDKGTDLARAVADYASSPSVTRASLKAYVKRDNDREDVPCVRVDLSDGTHFGAALTGIPVRRPHGGDADDGGHDDHDGDNRFAQTSPTQTDDVPGGHLITIMVAGSTGPSVVSVFVSSSSVAHAVDQRMLVLVLAAIAALLIAVVAAELVSRRLVRGLDAAAATADRLGDGDLEARAPEDGPAEVRRVAVALNRLAVRIDDLLLLERETVADLSHRLRTPLTAVRLDVEALPPTPQRAELNDHLDLLERTLTAVIRAARRPEREGAIPHCDAREVAEARVEFWRPLVEEQGRETTLELPSGAVTVRCATGDLAAAIDALLENVVAHTPDSTALAVVLVEDGRQVRLEVRDRGPGIPQGALGRGRSDRDSSGLGLDIARRCAESSGGRLEITRRDGWTVVAMVLGRP